MRLKVIKDTPASKEFWDEVVTGTECATYFHTREWAELWERYTDKKLKAVPRKLVLSDGTEVLLPVSVEAISKGLQRQFFSTPAWAYGGWLSVNRLLPVHYQELFKNIAHVNLVLRQNPFDTTLAESNLDWSWSDTVQVLDLRTNFEDLCSMWRRSRSGIMRKVAKAKKAQIIVEPARDLADWKEYYRAYQASQQRWKVVLGLKFDWKLFEEMYNLNSSKIKLWLAKLDGQVLCGAVCFYHNKHVAYWHGAAFEEYFKLRPVNLLHYHIIEQAIQDRYWWYDFGPSANLKNLEDFKASFGSQKLASHILMNKNRTRQFFEKLKTTAKTRKFLS